MKSLWYKEGNTLGGQSDSKLVNKNLQGDVDFLKDWYTPEIMKASLCDITSTEADSKKANAIIAVQSQSGVDCRFDEAQNPKFIKEGVTKEFTQAFQLLEKTKLPVCFIRGIPHYDEGYQAKIAQHYIFLYFFYNYENKKSVLIVDPQGSKFGDRHTADGNRAIDNEAVHIIGEAAKANDVKIYISQDIIQQDARSCGPVSVELARIFYEVSGDQNKKEELFKVLSGSKEVQAKCDDNSGYILQYQVCTLGDRFIPKEVVEDFDRKVKHEFANNSSEEVGGQSIRRIHYDSTALINDEGIKKIKGGEGNYTESGEPFLKKLGSTINSEDLCPSFKSGIIAGTPLLNSEQIKQVKQNRREKIGSKDLQPRALTLDNTYTPKHTKLKSRDSTTNTTVMTIGIVSVCAIAGAVIAYLAVAATLTPPLVLLLQCSSYLLPWVHW